MKGVLVYLGVLILVLAGLVWGGPAQSATIVYEWTNRHGSLCWTDDLTRVPEAYLSQTVTRLVDGLVNYPKYTRGYVEVTEE